jgi:hypothetical protein
MEAGVAGFFLRLGWRGLAGDLEFKVRREFLAGAPCDAGERHSRAQEDLAAGLIDEAVAEEITGAKREGVPDVTEEDGFE